MYRGLVFISLLLISFFPLESDASPIEIVRNLAENNLKVKPKQMAPSPSPVSNINLSSGGVQVPAISPVVESKVTETCEMVSPRCQDRNMIACLSQPLSGPQGLFLLILNDGESNLKVNVTILPVNITYKEMDITGHKDNKINISASVGRSSIILVKAGNRGCIIHMRATVPQDNFGGQFPYATYVTPISGTYILFGAALIIGGTWAYCKMGKRGRHLDGVPYEELEMGQPESLSSVNVETTKGWDQGWDDEWDEEKAIKSSSGNHVGSKPANGLSSRSSNSDGWGNDWDD